MVLVKIFLVHFRVNVTVDLMVTALTALISMNVLIFLATNMLSAKTALVHTLANAKMVSEVMVSHVVMSMNVLRELTIVTKTLSVQTA